MSLGPPLALVAHYQLALTRDIKPVGAIVSDVMSASLAVGHRIDCWEFGGNCGRRPVRSGTSTFTSMHFEYDVADPNFVAVLQSRIVFRFIVDQYRLVLAATEIRMCLAANAHK